MADSARIEELKRRVLLDPASIAFAALAEEYRRGGLFEAAIATCQAGLQRHPAYLSARVTLGRALLELGRYDEARTELELVLRSAPENLAAIRGLAEIHHRVGDLPETVPIEAPAPIAPAVVAPLVAAPPPVAPVPVATAAVAPRAAPPVTAPPATTPPPAAKSPAAPAHVALVTVAPAPPVPLAPPVLTSRGLPDPAPSRFAAAPPAFPPRDEEALPALEALLMAITAARSSAR